MIYTPEQFSQIAKQLSDALMNYELEQRISKGLRQAKYETEKQIDDLLDRITALEVENLKLKEIAKYE